MTQQTRIQPRHVGRVAVAAAMVLGVLHLGAGTSTGATMQFCNLTPIIGVGGEQSAPAPNASNPYPSSITVANLSGTITDVNVKLFDVTTQPDHDAAHWPEDLDVALVGPNNANTMLMTDAGGGNDLPHQIVAADLTLDDQAGSVLPADTQISSGTFRPVDDDNDPNEPIPNDVFPGVASPSNTASLATFNGIAANGVWKLYAIDDTNLAAVDISGGWCIEITTGGTGGTTTTLPATTTTTRPTTTTTTTKPTTTTTTTVPGSSAPILSVGEVVLTEGDAKTRTAYFPVTLSKASTQTVTVNYATAAGTAAGADFAAKSGTLTLVAGKVKGTIAVPVKGDTVDEAEETFSVNLSAPTNATIGDGTGTGTIRDDDPGSGLRATIGDVTTYEGDVGAQTATFTVSLSAPSVNTVTVNYATADGSAVAPSDYTTRTGTVTFAPGAVSKSVAIPVRSNTGAEPNETFTVVLSNPTGGATITDGTGVGTVGNDD